MGYHHCYIVDRFGRPAPRLASLSWRDTRRLEHRRREHRGDVHADWRERAEILTDLEIEAGTRMWTDEQLHAVLGLDPGRLRQGTLATPLLIAALAHVRGLPR